MKKMQKVSGNMEKLLKSTEEYLLYVNNECMLNTSVHFDYYNFKMLPQFEELSKFNSHNNSFCIKVKGSEANYGRCIMYQREMYKILNNKDFLIHRCHAGVYQFLCPFKKNGKLIGFVSISGYKNKIFKDEKEMPLMLCKTLITPLVVMLERLFSLYEKKSEDEYNAICQFLNEYHSNVTLFDLCECFMRSKSHISHLFKKRSGMTIKEYCNELKLSDAKKLLKETNFSVTEIAYDSGFNDVSYFISLFKKKYGVTPLKYRQKN